MPQRTARRPAFFLSLVMPAAALVAACGSRGGLLDDTIVQPVGVDAAGGGNGGTGGAGSTGVGGTGGTGGTGSDGGAGSTDGGTTAADASVPARDAGRDAASDGGLINCGTCVATSCGTDLAACFADTACRTTLQCVATTCLGTGGGTPSPTCFLTCANGDTSSLAKLIGIFTCITSNCGADCGGVLGGLGGLGGGGFAPSSAESAAGVDERIGHARARALFSEYLPYLPGVCAAGE